MVITLTVPDADMPRVVDAICITHDYVDTINGLPNPETRGQFAKRMLIQMIKIWVRDAELRAARQTISTSADAIAIT